MKSSEIVVGRDYVLRRSDREVHYLGMQRFKRVRVIKKGVVRTVSKKEDTGLYYSPTVKRPAKRADGINVVLCNIDGTVVMADSVRPEIKTVHSRSITSDWGTFYKRKVENQRRLVDLHLQELRAVNAAREVALILRQFGIDAFAHRGRVCFDPEDILEWHAGLEHPQRAQDEGVSKDAEMKRKVAMLNTMMRNLGYNKNGEVNE